MLRIASTRALLFCAAWLAVCLLAGCGGSSHHTSSAKSAPEAGASSTTTATPKGSTSARRSAGSPASKPRARRPFSGGSPGASAPGGRAPGRRERILFSPGKRTPLSNNYTYAFAAYLIGADEPLHFFRQAPRIPPLVIKRVQAGLRLSAHYLTIAAGEAKSSAGAASFAGPMNQLAARLFALRSAVGRHQSSLAEVQSLQNDFVSIYHGLRSRGYSLGMEPKGAHLPR
jgi:hypothetical protein